MTPQEQRTARARQTPWFITPMPKERLARIPNPSIVGLWRVRNRNNGHFYVVTRCNRGNGDEWECDCPDARHNNGLRCKHIEAVRLWLAGEITAEIEPGFEELVGQGQASESTQTKAPQTHTPKGENQTQKGDTPMFSQDIIERLEQPISPDRVKTRKAPGGRTVSYIEGHDAIATANAIFGYGEWGYEVKAIHRDGRLVYATVTVQVRDAVPFTDVGVCIARAKGGEEPTFEAVETAIKGAVTDGVKRALKNYGPQFGLSLYDKGNGKAGGNSANGSGNGSDQSNPPDVKVPEPTKERTAKARAYVVPFGKHKGKTLGDLLDGDEDDQTYLKWLAGLIAFGDRYFEAKGNGNAQLQAAARYLCEL